MTAAVLGFLLVGGAGCSQVFWRPDLGGAMRLAAERNQIVFVAYWSMFDEECNRMDERVFTHPDVVRSLRSTINVKLPSLTNKDFATRYGLPGPPAFVLFAPDGRVLRIESGYLNEGRLRGIIESARLVR